MSEKLRQLILEADVSGGQKAEMLAALAPVTAVVKAARRVCDSIFVESWNQKGWSWLQKPIKTLKKTIEFLDDSEGP